MEFTVSLNDIVLIALGIAGMVLIVYLIRMVRVMTVTLGKLNDTLDDVSVIVGDAQTVSGAVAEKTERVSDAVDGFADTALGVASLLHDNQSMIRAAANLTNAGAAIFNMKSMRDAKADRRYEEAMARAEKRSRSKNADRTADGSTGSRRGGKKHKK